MNTIRLISAATALYFAAVAYGGSFDSGSDGSDGAFNPLSNTVIDLSLAADGDWDDPSPVAGQGVYDANKWVVVFKYTTIDIPAGVTVTFTNHPSHAPVVWLATGNVNIAGAVSVNGAAGANSSVVRDFSEPGPGGFGGGSRGFNTSNLNSSAGLGPGGGSNNSGSAICGGSGAYGQNGGTFCGSGGGSLYGNVAVFPLIGGSGAGAGNNSISGGGGAGAGAIVIATSEDMTLAGTGSITANGGAGGNNGSGGAGGGIRLIGNTIDGAGALSAVGGLNSGTGAGGAIGRIRVEATTNNLTNGGNPNFVYDAVPGPVFAAAQPVLRIVSIGGTPVPSDPDGGITTNDVTINSAAAQSVVIQGQNVPVGTNVTLRFVPARGTPTSFGMGALMDIGGGILQTSSNITFPAGPSEIQLRAVWTP